MRRLHANPLTTIYVTHDQSEAMTTADRIVVMNAGQSSRPARPRTSTTGRARIRRALHRLEQHFEGQARDAGRVEVAGMPLRCIGDRSSRAPRPQSPFVSTRSRMTATTRGSRERSSGDRHQPCLPWRQPRLYGRAGRRHPVPRRDLRRSTACRRVIRSGSICRRRAAACWWGSVAKFWWGERKQGDRGRI